MRFVAAALVLLVSSAAPAKPDHRLLAAAEAAHRAAPDDPALGFTYALQLKMAWRIDDAKVVLRRYQTPQAHLGLVLFYMMSQEYDQAARMIPSTSAEFPPDDRDFLTLSQGEIELYRGRYADAIRFFDEGIRTRPENNLARARRAEAVLKSGRTKEALPLFDEVLQSNDHYLPALYYKAVALERLGDGVAARGLLERALAAGERTLSKKDDDGRDHFLLAEVCARLGLKDRAAAYRLDAQKLHYRYEAPLPPAR